MKISTTRKGCDKIPAPSGRFLTQKFDVTDCVRVQVRESPLWRRIFRSDRGQTCSLLLTSATPSQTSRPSRRRHTDEGRKQHEFLQERQRLQQRIKLTHLRSLAYGLVSESRRQLKRRIYRRCTLCRMCMRHFTGKALPVQNVMLPILQEPLRNFVADTLGETQQEQNLRPRCTLNH